jgi:hypothetical protein
MLEQSLLSQWFLVPYNSSSMKLGSANEHKALVGLVFFLQANNYIVHGNISSRGLLKMKINDEPSLIGTSIDGAVILQALDNPDLVPAVIEVKTLTTQRTLLEGQQRLSSMQSLLGNVTQTFFRTMFLSDLCKQLVWKKEHQSQILHHAAVTGVHSVLFVVASLSNILYTCLVEFSENDLQTYRTLMIRLTTTHLPYYCNTNPDAEVPFTNFGHAVDAHTVQV